MRRFGLLSTLIGLLFLAACAPRVQLQGPVLGKAFITDAQFVAEDGTRLRLRHWPIETAEAKATLLMLHGFNEYGGALRRPAEALAARGYEVYALDQRGFGYDVGRGIWPGAERMVADAAELTRRLAARHPDRPLHLIGVSMGGAVALSVAAEPDTPVDQVVAVAPAVWSRDQMTEMERFGLWLGAHTLPWVEFTGEGLDIHPSDNIAMLYELGADPLVIKRTRMDTIWGLVNLMDLAVGRLREIDRPVLILYGQKDDLVRARPMLRAAEHLAAIDPEFRLGFYEDGYHMLLRDLEAERALNDVDAWLTAPDQPLPSGADKNAFSRLAQHAWPNGRKNGDGGG